MKNKISQRTLLLICSIMLLAACKKDWLNAKPDKALVVPSKIADYQALLDNTKGATNPMNIDVPSLSMVGDGDYYITDATFNSLGVGTEQSAYLWGPTENFYAGHASGDWVSAYGRILNTNVVLDGLAAIKPDQSSQAAYNNAKGSALFFRCYDYFSLSQQYCKAYSPSTSGSDLGLPLRLSSNVNLTVERSTVQQTYDQIINDLLQASQLLPVNTTFPTRPTKAAAFGLLARVYLSQDNYPKAFLYADSCLQLNSNLLDYNKVSTTSPFPLSYFNVEVIFHTQLAGYLSFNPPNLIVDPGLYQLYDGNDLRQKIFFKTQAGIITNKTSYIGSAFQPFGGIATDEMYLIRAECNARAGQIVAALNDLNNLLKNRYKNGTFSALTATNADAALSLILNERRKELCYRNIRWSDLRRLNKDPRFQVTLSRIVNGKTYTLVPNSPRYVLPIDPIEIERGGLQQNPR
ncbi:RagB/SusD family nutrient uptake outer membrane protein [Mucilaginibacter sp. 14171R-50]|uniref:RagB/SusD family nutrient uptake outer membrane protein n=1 Tax=Mucilaginibacter sp. 14171R-50 TaxID=2703789 RepID=UPI00138D8064|nr:RagB/SusD family nutrient uptake outer membrane protein [Mucilaginibacter sp. 14171R-50]QHS55264.1 RagB/SusD family nutrient uptake outer membrane protein [Mucilaginibacter sp. 14171R-50]